MSTSSVSRLARALQAQALRTQRHHAKEPLRGLVRSAVPLKVEVANNVVLEDEHLTLSQSVARYHQRYGLAAGDSLIVQPVGRSEFVAVAVIATASGRGGMDVSYVDATGEYIGGGDLQDGVVVGSSASGSVQGTPLVARVPFYDSAGNIVGYVPII